MWMVITTFLFVEIYMITLSITLYFLQKDCEYPAETIAGDVFLWICSRTIEYEVWIFPLVYIFWPRSLTKTLRKKCPCCFRKRVHSITKAEEEQKSKQIIEETKDNETSDSSFIPSDSDEEIIEEN